MPDWPKLTTRFELDLPFGDDVRPTDADLDAFEARFGLKLPDDYRRFVLALGAGEIVGISSSNSMLAPGGPPGFHFKADLVLHNAEDPNGFSLRAALRHQNSFGTPRPESVELERQVEGMIFFFNAGEGEDSFAWKKAEVTDPATRDMAIYRVERAPKKVERVASTFREFVVDYLLSGRYERENFADMKDHRPDPSKVYTYMQYAYPGRDSD